MNETKKIFSTKRWDILVLIHIVTLITGAILIGTAIFNNVIPEFLLTFSVTVLLLVGLITGVIISCNRKMRIFTIVETIIAFTSLIFCSIIISYTSKPLPCSLRVIEGSIATIAMIIILSHLIAIVLKSD